STNPTVNRYAAQITSSAAATIATTARARPPRAVDARTTAAATGATPSAVALHAAAAPHAAPTRAARPTVGRSRNRSAAQAVAHTNAAAQGSSVASEPFARTVGEK